MKIKAADIARELQISKATVSLALNNKPGVSEQTRQEILDCKKLLESRNIEKTASAIQEKQIIKVIFMHRDLKVAYGSEMDLWTNVLRVYDKESKKLGYSLGVTYVNLLKDPVEQIVNECNMNSVAGVILCATEMQEKDYELVKNINKPMIITDNDFEDNSHHRVCIDNISAVKQAVDYLLKRNLKNIVYLANEIDIYNFMQRRNGFKQAIWNSGLEFRPDMIVRMGRMIENANEKMKLYLRENPLPDAFIMENYQVSAGVMKAMKAEGILVPEHISLIGVDEVPSYAVEDYKLTTIKIDHVNRPVMAMTLLYKEIKENMQTKFKVLSDCTLLEGGSVRG
ncbi:MAG TPA: LacI family transcriptional regulator [Clostridiales bacterium]|nr:LacI family transcriptional regulator [Clostridiales bacterium]